MSQQNWQDAHNYFKQTVDYILDQPESQGVHFKGDLSKIRSCSFFLCGNTSGGKEVFQDNGDVYEIKREFDSWLLEYPKYEKAIPQSVLINLLHILSEKPDQHGEVAFSPSEHDWHDVDESFEEVRNFAKAELERLGNPPVLLESYEWFTKDI